jgi:hypothetical protein
MQDSVKSTKDLRSSIICFPHSTNAYLNFLYKLTMLDI